MPFLLSRLGIFVAGQLALAWGSLRPGVQRFSDHPWIDMWARWDSGWYLSITTGGYDYIPGEPSNVAFFPLYPLMIRLLSTGSRNNDILIVTGWIIANVSTLLAFYFLYRLILLDDDPSVGRRAIWLLAFFPTSFFLSVVYTEGAFLILTVVAFYAARKRSWLVAGLSGGLSAVTRILGAFLILPLAWEWYQQKPLRWSSALSLLLIPLGLAAYMVYLGHSFGDPFLFSKAQIYWGRSVSLLAIVDSIKNLIANPIPFLYERGVTAFQVSFLLPALLLLAVVIRKQRLSYTLYAVYSVAIPLTSISTISFSRFIVVIFPLFIAMAQLLFKPLPFRLALIAMAVLQVILVVRWTLWYWVA